MKSGKYHFNKGKSNPNYKHGKSIRYKEYYCKECHCKISVTSGYYGKGYCKKCCQKGTRSAGWIGKEERNRRKSQRAKQYYKENTKKCLKRNSLWALNHPEAMKKHQRNWKINNPAKVIWYGLYHRAKRSQLSFRITKQQFIVWHTKQIKKCIYCGIKENELPKNLLLTLNKGFKLTIDRKNNNKGYTLNNITLCCLRCNFIKSDFFTYKEMLKIGKNYVKPKRL